MCCPNWAYNASWFYRNTISGLDPVQGVARDCYLIAALSALAWTCPSRIKSPDASGNVTVNLSGTNYTATRTEPLPVDTSNNLCCARSMDVNETWPGIYEKLYALFRGVPIVGSGPDICNQMPDGNALETLNVLSGWRAALPLLVNTYNANTLWNAVTPLTNGTKVKYPMVAWTYPTVTPPQPGTAIYIKHSYSVLGVHTAGGTNYLVLRNPFGSVTANPGISMLTSGSWTYTETTYTAPNVAAAMPRPFAKTLSFDLTKGIFALPMQEVLTYIEGIGYVT